MELSTVCWVDFWLLEGAKSLLEVTASQVIETSSEKLNVAALSFVASPIKNKGNVEEENSCPQVETDN